MSTRSLLSSALLGALALQPACGPKQAQVEAAAAETAELPEYMSGDMTYNAAQHEFFVGTWKGTVSSVVYHFYVEGEQLQLEAWDSMDDEWVLIDALSWQEESFTFTTTVRSADNWTLNHRLKLISQARIDQLITGEVEAKLVLYRIEGLEPPERPR